MYFDLFIIDYAQHSVRCLRGAAAGYRHRRRCCYNCWCCPHDARLMISYACLCVSACVGVRNFNHVWSDTDRSSNENRQILISWQRAAAAAAAAAAEIAVKFHLKLKQSSSALKCWKHNRETCFFTSCICTTFICNKKHLLLRITEFTRTLFDKHLAENALYCKYWAKVLIQLRKTQTLM